MRPSMVIESNNCKAECLAVQNNLENVGTYLKTLFAIHYCIYSYVDK